MFNINLYLEKFKNFGQGEREQKKIISLKVKEVTGLDLKVESILIKNGEAFLKASPGIKSAIFIKKETILGALKEAGVNNITNLR